VKRKKVSILLNLLGLVRPRFLSFFFRGFLLLYFVVLPGANMTKKGRFHRSFPCDLGATSVASLETKCARP